MKSGARYRLEEGSNDIGATIHVDDSKGATVDLDWKSIDRILFEPAPLERKPTRAAEDAAVEAAPARLYGEVATEAGTFRGFIQWDSQECLATDRLDGDVGNERVSLAMGGIRAIEKKSFHGALVETKDGRKLDVSGTNDVDDSIRGILIEDERYGRVKLPWHAFRRVDFRDVPAPGRGYGDYPPGRSLQGTVTLLDGKKWRGKIVFDLDESETWEMLDGVREEIEYSIPFERIRVLEPGPDKTTMVTLRNGPALRLGESQDVSDKNAGVLVLKSETEPEHYVRWAEVARIDFD